MPLYTHNSTLDSSYTQGGAEAFTLRTSTHLSTSPWQYGHFLWCSYDSISAAHFAHVTSDRMGPRVAPGTLKQMMHVISPPIVDSGTSGTRAWSWLREADSWWRRKVDRGESEASCG